MTNDLLTYFLSPLLVISLLIAVLIALNKVFNRYLQNQPEKKLQKQVGMLIATLILTIVAVVLLPIDETLRGQILSLLGILLSAAIALSATTFLGNALAGILLRNLRSFKIGDFVYINEYFGRVSGRGLFHLEIQTEDRDLLTLPNLYVTNNPVKVTRESGTIVFTEVSLGYDVPRKRVEEVLLQAATAAGLEEPFVYLIKLGDFSVVYQVKGLLSDVKLLLSARSRLNGQVLDALHCAGIEIVSPNFMNTRNVETTSFIPKVLVAAPGATIINKPEDIVFDKAEQAETLEEQKAALVEIERQLQELEDVEQKDAPVNSQLERGKRLKHQHAILQDRINHATEELASEKKSEKKS